MELRIEKTNSKSSRIGIICIRSKKIPILSTVFMNNETIFKAKKNKIKIIKIERNMNYLKKLERYIKAKKM